MAEIAAPTVAGAVGTKPKRIEESRRPRQHAGRPRRTGAAPSIARMQSPDGLGRPGQRPEFDEYNRGTAGSLVSSPARPTARSPCFEVAAGRWGHRRGAAEKWVRYSTPGAEGAEYPRSVLPAFALARYRALRSVSTFTLSRSADVVRPAFTAVPCVRRPLAPDSPRCARPCVHTVPRLHSTLEDAIDSTNPMQTWAVRRLVMPKGQVLRGRIGRGAIVLGAHVALIYAVVASLHRALAGPGPSRCRPRAGSPRPNACRWEKPLQPPMPELDTPNVTGSRTRCVRSSRGRYRRSTCRRYRTPSRPSPPSPPSVDPWYGRARSRPIRCSRGA